MTPLTADERAAFTRAICAAPDDSHPRLVYADRLDEAGDPRGEFIRVGCELASRFPGWSGEPAANSLLASGDYAALRSREQSLLQAHREAWEPKVPGLRTKADVRRANATVVGCCNRHADNMACDCLANATEWEFRRGFPEAVTLDWPAACARLDAVLAAVPVTTVTLTSWPEWEGDGRGEEYLRLHGCERWHLIPFSELPNGSARATIVRKLLAAEWPRVRAESWHLPPAPQTLTLRNGETAQVTGPVVTLT